MIELGNERQGDVLAPLISSLITAVASGRAGGAMALPIIHDGNDIHTVSLRKRATFFTRRKTCEVVSEIASVCLYSANMLVYRQNKVTRCDANFIDIPGVANRRAKFEDGQLLKLFVEV